MQIVGECSTLSLQPVNHVSPHKVEAGEGRDRASIEVETQDLIGVEVEPVGPLDEVEVVETTCGDVQLGVNGLTVGSEGESNIEVSGVGCFEGSLINPYHIHAHIGQCGVRLDNHLEWGGREWLCIYPNTELIVRCTHLEGIEYRNKKIDIAEVVGLIKVFLKLNSGVDGPGELCEVGVLYEMDDSKVLILVNWQIHVPELIEGSSIIDDDFRHKVSGPDVPGEDSKTNIIAGRLCLEHQEADSHIGRRWVCDKKWLCEVLGCGPRSCLKE